MTTLKRLIAIVPLAVSLNACGGDNQKVDLGNDGKPGSTAQGLAAYEGTWDGYAEAYHFDQGSDRVRVTLDSAGNGTIRLGDAPEFAPFSNPAIGYPEGLAYNDPDVKFSRSQVHEGFAYPVLDAKVESGRLHFAFWDTDIVKAWCEAQTSYPDLGYVPPAVGYVCNPAGDNSYSWNDGVCYVHDTEAADCGFVKTCFDCSCDAEGCSSFRVEGRELGLDGVLANDGDTLVGTLVVQGVSAPARITVRLTR
jgi:hypothetical protein